MNRNFHEHYCNEQTSMPSERSTGLVFAVVSLIVAYLWRDHRLVAIGSSLAAAIFLAMSLVAVRLLKPLNILWFNFGLLLNKIMSPIVMFALFLITIVPFGLAMQLVRDPLRKRRGHELKSYWIERTSQQDTSNMTNQF